MKSFAVAIVIAVFVVAGSLFYTHQIETVSDSLVSENLRVTQLLEEENYDEALECAEKMAEYVDRKKLSLAIIMDHGDLDKIELSVAELSGYIKGRVQTDSLAKCGMLNVMLRHMPKNYKLKIENIL